MHNVSLQEQYEREQEKLKKEWEKAQLEVEEEERKHNEEVQSHTEKKQTHESITCCFCMSDVSLLCVYIFQERRILEETVTPLNPTGLLNQQSAQTGMTSSAPENNETEGRNDPLQQNGQRISPGNEDQHASKLHFFQGELHTGMQTDVHSVSTCVCVFNPVFLRVSVIKVYFMMMIFVDSACDSEPSKKQELWKTASLDRNPQLNQAHVVKR